MSKGDQRTAGTGSAMMQERKCLKEHKMSDEERSDPYVRPELVKMDNLKGITRECPEWQCSVTVPPPPA